MNFQSISEGLQQYARRDIAYIKKVSSEIPQDGIITSTSLRIRHNYLKFHSLGFLVALMEEAERKFNPKVSDWMDFHANRGSTERKIIEFSPISITEFRVHPRRDLFIKKYYMFLDEFSALRENVFLRNLCRSTCFTCAVASTDTQIVNLVGTSIKSGSRNDGPKVWAAVVCQLSPILSESPVFLSFDQKKNTVLELAKMSLNDKEVEKMKIFFNYLLTDQLRSSRPGIVYILLECFDILIKNYKTKSFITFKKFFETLLVIFQYKLLAKKNRAFETYSGMKANVGLLSKHAFINNYSIRNSIKPSSSFVDDHFYHLIAPKFKDTEEKDIFALFHSLNFISPSVNLFDRKDRFCVEEFEVFSYFKEEETLLILACMFASIPASTSGVLHKTSISNVPLNYKELTASGNLLEVEALSAIIDSSHFSSTEPEGTFSGVRGDEFLVQVLENLNLNLRLHRKDRKFTSIKYPNSIVEKQIKSFKVPFLYSSDLKFPDVFYKLFPVSEDSGCIGNYERMARADQIDGCFDVLKLEDDSTWKPSRAIVATKNYSEGINQQEYISIIDKAIKSPFKGFLHIAIITKAPKFTETEGLKDFLNLSRTIHKINYFRFKKHLNDSKIEYEIVPISNNMFLHPNPEMVCLIIETDVINDRFKKVGIKLTKTK